jgi:hypothetical protein
MPFAPSTMPFDMLKALSLNPKLLRFVSRLLVFVSLAATSVRAAEAEQHPAPSGDAKIVVIVSTNNAPAIEASAAAPTKVDAAAPAKEPVKQVVRESAKETPKEPAKAPAPAVATAPAKTNLPPTNLEAFKLIADRNIFNQSRSPRISSASRGSETNEVRRAPRIDAFALVGTMSFEKGDFAFFDSGNTQYRKTLKPGDEIAGYHIKEVQPNHVALVQGDAVTELKIGQQLRREDDGPWQVTAHSGSFAGASSGATSSSSSTSGGTGSSGGGSASDILKRLMEQRARER